MRPRNILTDAWRNHPIQIVLSFVFLMSGIIVMLFRGQSRNVFVVEKGDVPTVSNSQAKMINQVLEFDKSYAAKLTEGDLLKQHDQMKKMLFGVAADPLTANKLAFVLATKEFRVTVVEESTLTGRNNSAAVSGMFYVPTNTLFITENTLKYYLNSLRYAFLFQLHHAFIYHLGKGTMSQPFKTDSEFKKIKAAVSECYQVRIDTLESLRMKKIHGSLTANEKAQYDIYAYALKDYVPKVFAFEWDMDESAFLSVQQSLIDKKKVTVVGGIEVLNIAKINGKFLGFGTYTAYPDGVQDKVRTFVADTVRIRKDQTTVYTQQFERDGSGGTLERLLVTVADAEFHANPQLLFFCPKLKKYHEKFRSPDETPFVSSGVKKSLKL